MKLRDQLENANRYSVSTGGVWKLTNAPTFPYTLNVNGVSNTYADNATVGSDDNPDVDWVRDTLTFTYYTSAGGCSSSADLTINKLSREVTATTSQTTTNTPYSKGNLYDTNNTVINNISLTDAAKSITKTTLVHKATVQGNPSNSTVTVAQYIQLSITKANLNTGSILVIGLVNNYGSSQSISIPDYSALNTAGTTFSSAFVNALNSAMDFNTIASNNGGITFDPKVITEFGKLITFSLGPGNTTLVLTIPITFIPSTYTATHWNVDIDNACLFSNVAGTTPITFTNNGLSPNNSRISLSNRVPLTNSPCIFTTEYVDMALTWTSAGTKSLLGNGKFVLTDSSYINPTSCTTTTIVASSTPVPVNPKWRWTLPSGVISPVTGDTLTVVDKGTYQVELTCSDCPSTYTKNIPV